MASSKGDRRALVRDCARRWRGQEGQLISELADHLPFPDHVRASLNKPSIFRLVNNHIKVKHIEAEVGMSIEHVGGTDVFVDVIDGFMMTLDNTGSILHVSPQINRMLGYEQHELLGTNILEFTHPDDHKTLLKQLFPINSMGKKSSKEYAKQGPPILIESHARMKFKTFNIYNKTKQTGFMSVQLRACLKKVQPRNGNNKPYIDWLLFVTCYPQLIVPQLKLSYYDAAFIFKMDKNLNCVYIPDSYIEYFGTDAEIFMDKDKYFEVSWDNQCSKASCHEHIDKYKKVGSVECVCNCIYKETWYHMFGKTFQICDSRGEHHSSLSIVLVLSKDRVKVNQWPENKLAICWTEYINIPGEDINLADVTEDISKLGISKVYLTELEEKQDGETEPDSGYSSPHTGSTTSQPFSPAFLSELTANSSSQDAHTTMNDTFCSDEHVFKHDEIIMDENSLDYQKQDEQDVALPDVSLLDACVNEEHVSLLDEILSDGEVSKEPNICLSATNNSTISDLIFTEHSLSDDLSKSERDSLDTGINFSDLNGVFSGFEVFPQSNSSVEDEQNWRMTNPGLLDSIMDTE